LAAKLLFGPWKQRAFFAIYRQEANGPYEKSGDKPRSFPSDITD
jgi:hypothetical protein